MKLLGRYALYEELAAGGMATVHYGRLLGSVGFARTVAIKRLHPQFAKDPDFVSMFVDEARLAARIHHPNVVPTLDVVATRGELFLVLDYVHGQSLSKLMSRERAAGTPIPLRIVASIVAGALHGLHAAHEARDERGESLNIVHRDVSPQNVLVGTDGVPRVIDFGVAKAAGRLQTTREGQVKGKLAYMAPEQLDGEVTRRSDVYAASIVLWEAIAGARLFSGDSEGAIVRKILSAVVSPPSIARLAAGGPPPDAEEKRALDALDAVALRGLEREPAQRFATARDMALAVEQCLGLAPASEVGAWVETVAANLLSSRASAVAEIEASCERAPHRLGALALDSGGDLTTPVDVEESTRSLLNASPGDAATGSQLSSISVSRGGDSPTSPRRARTVILVACTVGLVATGIFVERHSRPDASSSRPTTLPAPVVSGVPDPALQLEAGVEAPAASVDAPLAASSSGPIAPLPSSPSLSSAARAPASSAVSAPPAPARHPAAHSSSPAPNCSPPYTVDSAGRRHYRAECL
jgi:serine/threonine-protein kinase